MIHKNNIRFPENVKFGDIVRGLPVDDDSASGVYASHVLEHLSREDFEAALKNTYDVLAPGGIFRLIVPDLEIRAKLYLERISRGDKQANDWFMESAHLGLKRRSRSLLQVMSRVLGNSHHLWMWDFTSMERALEVAGFTAIRRCRRGDSGDPMFDKVEEEGRFVEEDSGIVELAVQAVKPSNMRD
jgi:SAM-dependent methyltransferase